MSDYLVIVESPAKAKTIERYLGKKYKVKASMGHVRDLPKSQMGIDIEQDYNPKYITIRGKGPVLKELKTAAKKAKKIYLAADPDREGEAIAWHLAHSLDVDIASDCRVVFNEITKEAIKESFKHPRAINMDLVDAQQARRILDRLVGYNISPFAAVACFDALAVFVCRFGELKPLLFHLASHASWKPSRLRRMPCIGCRFQRASPSSRDTQ